MSIWIKLDLVRMSNCCPWKGPFLELILSLSPLHSSDSSELPQNFLYNLYIPSSLAEQEKCEVPITQSQVWLNFMQVSARSSSLVVWLVQITSTSTYTRSNQPWRWRQYISWKWWNRPWLQGLKTQKMRTVKTWKPIGSFVKNIITRRYWNLQLELLHEYTELCKLVV